MALELTIRDIETMYGASRGADRRRTRGELTRQSTGRTTKAADIKNLWQRHHEILNMHLLGMQNTEIATRLGITKESVSQIVNSTLGQEKLALLRVKRDSASFDVMCELQKLAQQAVGVYEEILESEEAGLALKKKTADQVLALQGYGPKSTLEVRGGLSHVLSTSHEVQEAIARGLEHARAEGLIVDATFEELPERSGGNDKLSQESAPSKDGI